MDTNPNILLKTIKNKIKLSKKNIFFIQIGVNDGITNDIAIDILDENDTGIFIEPMKDIYETMVKNKEKFKSSFFINSAIVPTQLKNNNKMNLLSNDELRQGSSFINVNSHRIIHQIEVDTITVNELLSKYNVKNIDFLFCDTEGIDFLIISDFLNILEPEVIFLETCNWWCEEDVNMMDTMNNIITIPSRHSFKLKLENLNYFVIDYYDDEYHKSQDMIAIKKNFLE